MFSGLRKCFYQHRVIPLSFVCKTHCWTKFERMKNILHLFELVQQLPPPQVLSRPRTPKRNFYKYVKTISCLYVFVELSLPILSRRRRSCQLSCAASLLGLPPLSGHEQPGPHGLRCYKWHRGEREVQVVRNIFGWWRKSNVMFYCSIDIWIQKTLEISFVGWIYNPFTPELKKYILPTF